MFLETEVDRNVEIRGKTKLTATQGKLRTREIEKISRHLVFGHGVIICLDLKVMTDPWVVSFALPHRSLVRVCVLSCSS